MSKHHKEVQAESTSMSQKGEAVRSILEYAMKNKNFSEGALQDYYRVLGHNVPFHVALETAKGAGYLVASMVPKVYLSGFTPNGVLKLKPSRAINCTGVNYLTMP